VEQNRLPQKRLAAYITEKGISYIDAYDYFARAGEDTSANFLYVDFGHLSKKGHRIVSNLLKERLSAPASAVRTDSSAQQKRAIVAPGGKAVSGLKL
ncbi:MAG: hypothetical protein LC731_08080, partial [Acidobacteria bacterium]|nr:hypothetical protein [Acidobacteriota bacterium]